MRGLKLALILGTLILGSAGAPASTAVAVPGVWEPHGLDGYDVLNIEQQGEYLYAAVYPSPVWPDFGHGVWRRHEHPDSSG